MKFLMSEIIKYTLQQQDLKLLLYLQGTVVFYNCFSPVRPCKMNALQQVTEAQYVASNMLFLFS